MRFEITPAELAQKLKEEKQSIVLLDVREHWEFNLARIDGSELIPLGQLTERIDELDPQAEIVAICHHGVRSLNAAYFLTQKGFSNVRSLAGGLDLWSQVVDPSVPRY